MSILTRANCIILRYPDARQRAACAKGMTAVYFIGGSLNGQQWTMPPIALSRKLVMGDEAYQLHILRESKSPKLMYPFYVYQSLSKTIR